jgi:hypothetical protein
MKDEECNTLDIPTAGKRYWGLSQNGSYVAAQRGDIPTIKIGGRKRVPVIACERMLEEAAKIALERMLAEADKKGTAK